ncbi:DUF6036 family nucleotidyltransferase [Listeria newyorkensis]|uniref:DUF6036 domain-containing protein n=1 Tax=Listeria newyorkensis TaxID=1497681 RepID=A0A841YSF8_9LIST|nr:DUF6036 family nucleotidyltransferase [Listeria newyorkensis]MBC1456215.1 hypothetical protein [Listeria newyorkensis]
MINNPNRYLQILLEEVNKEMVKNNVRAGVILIGGLLGKYLLQDEFRETFDIDIMIREVEDANSFRKVLDQFSIDEVTVVEIPPKEEIEFADVLRFSNLTVYIPTIEYFALTKLFSTRVKDEEDLQKTGILKHCNIIELLEMIDDYKAFVLNPKNRDYNFYNIDSYLKLNHIDRVSIIEK